MQLTRIALLSLAGLTPFSLCAQGDPKDPFLRWMNQIAQDQLNRRQNEIARIRTAADAAARKQQVRSKLLEILGGLPEYRGPLNARVTGRLVNPAYTIEKVIFESLPSYYVTANLYRPNQPGRYPAVLLSAGHTTLGKTENHRIGANLAAKGFVALAYDPVGLGERMQAYDRRTGRGIAGCCANEHLQAGAQSLLIGQSVARYFIWDSMKALDYLVSRSDVDADRIGAAGCSGGGCQTTYVAALDSRVKAAAPACFINSLKELFVGPFPDSEMSLPRFLASGLDHADFLEVSDNTPWLILATEGDFFAPTGVRLVYEEARSWYRVLGMEDRVQMFMGPGPHGTPLETREKLYGWMIRWLKGGEVEAREGNVPLYPDHELQVTASGQVEYEGGSRWLYQVIRDEFQARRQPLGIASLQEELRRLQIPSAQSRPSVETKQNQAGRVQLTLESEPGVFIEATLYPAGVPGRRPALLMVKDRSSGALAEAAAAQGQVVLELAPRDTPSANDNRPFLGNWMTNARADAIGHNLPARRAHDILRGVDFLCGRDDVDAGSIRAVARDVRGVWLLLAAAADQRIAKVWLDRTPNSLAAALDSPFNTNLFDATIPGFLLHWDLPDLVQSMGKRPVLWTDPTNWMGQTKPSGSGFRYRYSGEPDSAILTEFLR